MHSKILAFVLTLFPFFSVTTNSLQQEFREGLGFWEGIFKEYFIELVFLMIILLIIGFLIIKFFRHKDRPDEYRIMENDLYRDEIHDSGDVNATFKGSNDKHEHNSNFFQSS